MPTNNSMSSTEVASEPRRSATEKWLALIGFVVVTAAGVILIGFPK